ncbi:hypothetical protein Pcinc_002407 [Petrolisthes cinctipes]|uniref:Tc1-like transposase DDE domain-containing protein n=1 Tax=Petrolisthes cinctipes TaxID=88211 RepID=A0AAE1GLF6_PETCI|nr:hypothetical protein Pcinc_002407 [Petrolisthes cinctipes]
MHGMKESGATTAAIARELGVTLKARRTTALFTQPEWVRQWFTEHPEIEVLYWPAYSPDLNPIENCWGNIVNSWDPAQERTPLQLLQHTMTEWERFRRNDGIIYKIVGSVSDRLHEVIAHDGGWTHY